MAESGSDTVSRKTARSLPPLPVETTDVQSKRKRRQRLKSHNEENDVINSSDALHRTSNRTESSDGSRQFVQPISTPEHLHKNVKSNSFFDDTSDHIETEASRIKHRNKKVTLGSTNKSFAISVQRSDSNLDHSDLDSDTSDEESLRKRERRLKRNMNVSISTSRENEISKDSDNSRGIAFKLNERLQKKRQKLKQSKSESLEESQSDIFHDNSLSIDMSNLEGDISVISGENWNPLSVVSTSQRSIPSQPVGKYFIEQQSGFKVVDTLDKLRSCQESSPLKPPSPAVQFAVDLACGSQKLFHTFSTFCHGLLGGIALWQCIVSHELYSSSHSVEDFVHHYCTLALPLQTMFYFLLVICTVSVFDRFDIGRLQWSLVQRMLSFRFGILAIVIYPVTLFLSLSISDIDDKLALFQHNNTLWKNEETENEILSELQYWKNMNLARCIGAIMGWVLISLNSSLDYFREHLEGIGENHCKK